VAFYLLTRKGEVVPFDEVESLACAANIGVRGGCFCNPGAAEAAFGLGTDRAAACLARLDRDFTIERLRACLGTETPVGAIRASIGLANVAADIDRAVATIASFRE